MYTHKSGTGILVMGNIAGILGKSVELEITEDFK